MNFEDFIIIWDFICQDQIAERKDYSLAEQMDIYIDYLRKLKEK